MTMRMGILIGTLVCGYANVAVFAQMDEIAFWAEKDEIAREIADAETPDAVIAGMNALFSLYLKAENIAYFEPDIAEVWLSKHPTFIYNGFRYSLSQLGASPKIYVDLGVKTECGEVFQFDSCYLKIDFHERAHFFSLSCEQDGVLLHHNENKTYKLAHFSTTLRGNSSNANRWYWLYYIVPGAEPHQASWWEKILDRLLPKPAPRDPENVSKRPECVIRP